MTTEQRVFTNKDLSGPTGAYFQGTVTLMVGDTTQSVPVSAVGQVNWDGNGRATSAVRILNIGGAVILQQEAAGEYRVNPDGTGSATFQVTTVGATGSPPPGFALPTTVVETFSFVLAGPENDVHFIATGMQDAQTGQPLAAVIAGGLVRRQC